MLAPYCPISRIVQPPAPLVRVKVWCRFTALPFTVSLREAGDYAVRVRWSRYLSASDGCMRPTGDGWSEVVVQHSGIVKIEGSLAPRHC